MHNVGDSGDVRSALRAVEQSGATVQRQGYDVEISGNVCCEESVVSCGESGLCMRLFAPIVALRETETILLAEGSLRARAMRMVAEALTQFGAQCETDAGLAPLRIRGPLRPGRNAIDASTSSQHISGLMMALPLLNADSEIELVDPVSLPYLALTAEVMNRFGITVRVAPRHIAIPGGQSFRASEFDVGGDWSAAAFLLTAGAIAGNVRVHRLNATSSQADRRILDALQQVGADISIDDDTIGVASNRLQPFRVNLADTPDLAPPLAVLAARCEGESVLTGVARLRIKESNRLSALCATLGAMGVDITTHDDALVVRGGAIQGGTVTTHNDHRIVMAAATAALVAENETVIDGAEAVGKSYPSFFEDLRKLGAKLQ